jgi:hypothetical protein
MGVAIDRRRGLNRTFGSIASVMGRRSSSGKIEIRP